MKKAVFIAAILALVMAASIGAQAAQSYKIAYIPTSIGQPNTNAWLEGMMRVFRKYPNVKVQSFDPQLKAELQVSFMDDVVNQKYDFIVLQAQDAAALSQSVKMAEAKGIPVITVNLATLQKHTASVQMADISAGYAVGKEMGKQIGGKGNVVIIQSPPGALLGVNREKGFRQALAELYPNIKIVGAQSAEGWKKEIAITIMNSFLQANKQLDGVFAVNDNMAEGAMTAAEAAGRLSQIKIWGANGQKSTLALIEQGKIAGTAYNNCFAQGSLIAEMAMLNLMNKAGPSKDAETKVIQIPPFAATLETVKQIIAEDRW
ncbi:MAG: sugar ABC transporter substrate-binding protein [Spirochaetaceae bacterium]|nr:sugar ABC transporter substrate-binding protein [Spirochaetaceae bacterium]